MGLTAAGLAVLTGLAGNVDTQTAFTYLELGDGTTAFANSQTALASAITGNGLARASVDTVSREDTNETDDTLQLTHEWTASGSETIKEAGIFNASSAGSMLARTVLTSTQALTSGDTFSYTYQVVFA